MKFQTRLMLAFLFATTLVSVAVIQLTSNKVKAAYQRQFKQKFDSEVHYLFSAREKRSEGQLILGQKFAESDYIVKLLSGDKGADDARREFLDKLPQVPPPMKSGGGKKPEFAPSGPRLNRILAVMDIEGQITYISSPLEKKTARNHSRMRKNSIEKQLENLVQSEAQQVAYFPQKLPNGESIIRDLSVTPVKNPDSGEVIGAFLMSFSTAETAAERFLDRYHREVSDGHYENAILIDDSLYPSSVLGNYQEQREGDKSHFDELEKEVVENLAALPDGELSGNFEFTIHGEPHYVHFCAINPQSPFSTAWQVSAFPMTALKRDLNDLRIKGSGIGLTGMFLGMIAAWFLARNLSVPIQELSVGTRKISDGQLDIELPVRSKDEIGELTESFNRMTAELRLKERYRSLLGKVSDESVAQAMIEGTLNPQLGGELKKVSVLFCDIRGFTNLTETMAPQEVIEILNHHMTALTHVVREHFGVVDKFVGDEIMAVFGGLKSYGNDAANAAHCAIKMIEERDRLNREQGADIQIGIGIATGEIVAGCMGSEDRLNYTVLGAKVNLGARLCGRAGAREIVIDDETYAQILDLDPETEAIEGLLLKGFTNHVPAWKLSGARVRHSSTIEPISEPVRV
ncbi:MAG: adenylate/guanylate cyclase domain-containing protein [Verrucomicrobiales bacterium]|nr:adenylate/guanylate cyclase domain-containing protein [Verrucomicrobiales bacterium]